MKRTSEKFNITELIEYYYQEKLPLPEKFKTLNFQETTEIMVHFQGSGASNSGSYRVSETIAINIIKNLDFKAFKDMFSLDWLEQDRENKGIFAAIQGKQFELLNYVLDQVEKSAQTDLKPYVIDNSSVSLLNNILNPIKEYLGNAYFDQIGYTKDDMQQYFSIWKRNLDILGKNQNSFRIGYEREIGQSIAEKYIHTENSYKDTFLTLMEKLAGDKLYLDVFMEIFTQLNPEKQKEYGILLSETALSSANKKLVDYFEKNHFVSLDNYKNCIQHCFDIESYSSKHTNSNLLWIYKKIDAGIPQEEKNSIYPYAMLGMVKAFSSNAVVLDDILSKYPQVKTQGLLNDDNLTLGDINFVIKVANSLGIQTDKICGKIDTGPANIIKLLPTLNSKIEEVHGSTTVQKTQLYDVVIELLAYKENISSEKAKILFLETSLDFSLPDKENKARVKI